MAKENLNKCPEHNIYATEEERMSTNDTYLRPGIYFERTPVLDPHLRWVCPVQENCATKLNITGVGERISKRFWVAGFDERGQVLSVRSIGIATILMKAVGVVMEDGEDAPTLYAIRNESGEWALPPDSSYFHAMEDTSWFRDDGFVFSVIRPIAFKPAGSKEVYCPKFINGKFIISDGHIELETTNMKFYSLEEEPSEEEEKEATLEIRGAVGDHFYNEVSIVREYGVRFSEGYSRILKCPHDYQGTYKIPNDITEIGDYAFSYCQGITSVAIPNSVKRIGAKAFYNCKGLTTIEIPNSIEYISTDAFDDCNPIVVEIADTYRRKLEESIRRQREEEETARKLAAEHARQEAERAREEAKRIAAEQERLRIIKAREEEEQRRMQEQQMQEMLQGSILFFDTETTGTPQNYKAPITDSSNWPRLVQLAWIMADKSGNILKKKSVIIRPSGFSIPADAAAVHGITTEKAEREGVLLHDVLEEFEMDLSFAGQIVGHNIDFDQHIVGAELYRLGMNSGILMDKPCICTMKSSTDFCAIPNPNPYFGGYKWPSLQELYRKLFGHEFTGAHDALADITATKECYFELKRRGIIQ